MCIATCLGTQHEIPAFGGQQRCNIADAAELSLEHRRWYGLLPGPVTRPAQRRFSLEEHCDRWQARTSRQRQPGEPALGIEAKRVHHGRQPPPRACSDDLVEQCERVYRSVEVVLAATDYRAEPVGGHDLPGQVPLAR